MTIPVVTLTITHPNYDAPITRVLTPAELTTITDALDFAAVSEQPMSPDAQRLHIDLAHVLDNAGVPST